MGLNFNGKLLLALALLNTGIENYWTAFICCVMGLIFGQRRT